MPALFQICEETLSDVITDLEEGREGRLTQERRLGVCVKQRRAHGSSAQTCVRSAVRLSYDAFSSVCILHGILTASVISWNAHGNFFFFFKKTLGSTLHSSALSHQTEVSLRGLI